MSTNKSVATLNDQMLALVRQQQKEKVTQLELQKQNYQAEKEIKRQQAALTAAQEKWRGGQRLSSNETGRFKSSKKR